jgi:hypothetical protein
MNWTKSIFKRPSTGDTICKINGIQYADINTISRADWNLYNTCRGRRHKEAIIDNLDIIADVSYDEDARQDAINDGLWDLYIHQYTLYTVTPLVLDYLLNQISSNKYEPLEEFLEFIKICINGGTKSIYMTVREIVANKSGCLPIFKIEDVVGRYVVNSLQK